MYGMICFYLNIFIDVVIKIINVMNIIENIVLLALGFVKHDASALLMCLILLKNYNLFCHFYHFCTVSWLHIRSHLTSRIMVIISLKVKKM